MVLTCESVDEIRRCYHSYVSYWAVLFCGTVYHTPYGVVLSFEVSTEILIHVAIKVRAKGYYLPVLLFITVHKVIQTFWLWMKFCNVTFLSESYEALVF